MFPLHCNSRIKPWRFGKSWSEEVLLIKKKQKTVSWAYEKEDLTSEEAAGMVNEKELQNTNETNFRFKKVKKKEQ